MKKLLAILATSIVALTACGPRDAKTSSDGKTITVAFNQSKSHPQHLALREFGDELERQTKGRYKLNIQPNAILGSQTETLEMVQGGTLEMTLVSSSLLENYNSNYTAISLPYVYDSLKHQKAVFESDVFDELLASTTGKGFQAVAAYTAGARSVYTKTPINTKADLAGKKIRVMESESKVAMMNAMGGVGTPMSQGEVYTAIQQGIIDGGENNEVTYTDLKHYEVAPYFSYTEHLMVPDLVVVNNSFYNSMSAEDKTVFDALIQKSVEREFALWNESVETAKQTAINKGAKFIEPDKAEFKNASLALNEKTLASDSAMKATYDKIRALAD